MVKVCLGPACASDLISQVNFPQFVTGLLEGVFYALVNASARQMKGYAELVASVADPVPL